MKKILLIIFLGIFLVGLISAISICVDKTPPSAPSNLEVTISGDDVTLTWNASTDVPACSGVDYYVISNNGNNIGTSYSLSFQNINVNPGTYSYSVYAIDKIGHNSGLAIINDVVIVEVEGEMSVSGGGGGSSYVCESNWECTDWSECIREFRTRICHDTNNCSYSYNEPIERTDCETNFTLEGVTLEEEPAEEGFFSRITGAAIGGISDFAKSGAGAFVFVVLIVAAGGFVLLRVYKLRKR